MLEYLVWKNNHIFNDHFQDVLSIIIKTIHMILSWISVARDSHHQQIPSDSIQGWSVPLSSWAHDRLRITHSRNPWLGSDPLPTFSLRKLKKPLAPYGGLRLPSCVFLAVCFVSSLFVLGGASLLVMAINFVGFGPFPFLVSVVGFCVLYLFYLQ